MPKRVTLKDVAAAAGVSVATASAALSGKTSGTMRISSATVGRVQAAAERLSYVPLEAAKSLARGVTGRVAIVLPNLYQPYFSRVAALLIEELAAQGMRSTIRLTDDVPEREVEATLGMSTRDVDAVLVCPHHLSNELVAGREPHVPVVEVGGAQVDGMTWVAMDEYSGARAVAEHLVSLGRRRIAYLVRMGSMGEGGFRLAAYRDVLAGAGIEIDERLIVEGDDWDRRDTGLDAATGLLNSGIDFDALMCINDAVAIGALRAVQARGLRVPQDVAITGFDNTDEGAFSTPSLTTVDPGTLGMVRTAVSSLMLLLEGKSVPDVQLSPTRLLVRGSTAPALPDVL